MAMKVFSSAILRAKSVILTMILGSLAFNSYSQIQYVLESSMITFHSHAPIEDITASTNAAESTLNLNDGTISATVKISTFTFRKQLMQKHFNEQYMESGKYPVSRLNGKMTGDLAPLATGNQSLKTIVTGDLTIRGISKPIEEEVMLSVKDNKLTGTCRLKIRLEDYAIKIPKILSRNIAEVVDVTIEFTYKQK